MSHTHATAYAVTAAYREIPAGHLLTRVEAARRIAPLLGVAPAGVAGLRITDAIEAGDLVELRAAGDTRLTVPGAPAGAVVAVVPGTVEESVEIVIGNAEGTVEIALGGRGRRLAPALPLTRRSLVISAEDCKRLAAELHRLWAEVQTFAATGPEAIGDTLTAAGLPSTDTASRGWWVTHSGSDGRPMVLHMDGRRMSPRRTNEAELTEWAERLGAVEDALAADGFHVRRSGHAVIVYGRTVPGGAPQPADVVRVASRAVRRAHGSVTRVQQYLHVNCGCRIKSSLDGTYASTAEALAALKAEAAELDIRYVEPVTCRKNQPETGTAPAPVPAAEVEQLVEQPEAPAVEPAVEPDAPEAVQEAQRRAAAGAVRELLTAAGEVDLDAAGAGPVEASGFKAQPAGRPGVWVWVRRMAPAWSGPEHEQDLDRWAGVLRRAGWDTVTTVVYAAEAGIHATPPVASGEPPVEQAEEPAGRSGALQGVTVTPARWLMLAHGVQELDATAPAAPIAEAEPVVEQPAEPAAELVRVSGAWCITREQADAMGAKARADRETFEAESAERRAAERYHYGPERESAQRAAVEAARELLAAAGVPDLDETPTANTGVRLRKADRPGVWVMVRQIRGISTSRPDPQRQPFDAREWDHNFATWAGVLRRAGWETTEPSDLSFYAAPPAEAEQDVEDVVEAELVEDQEQPAEAPAAGAAVVLYVEEPLPPAAAEAARAIMAAGRKAGVLDFAEGPFDPRELVGSIFADGYPIEETAPAVVRWLDRAGQALAGGDVAEAEQHVEEAAAALHAATRTAGPAAWDRVARWLVSFDARRRSGAAGPLADGWDGGDLVEVVPRLPALVDAAARFLALWLTARSLVMLKAADQAARDVAEALHAGTGAGRQTAWLQVARYAVERQAAALVASAAVRPAAELPAGTGETGGAESAVEAAPVRPALLAPAAGPVPGESAEAARMRHLEYRMASDGRGPLPAGVRVLDYDLNSYEWGYECSRHGGGWERQPGQWEFRADAETNARMHAQQHARAADPLTDDQIAEALALGFSLQQHQVLGESRSGRVLENVDGFFYFDDQLFPSGRVQGRRVADLWARGLVELVEDVPGRRLIVATEAGAAADRLMSRARREDVAAYAERDTMRSTDRQRAAYPRIKAAPSPAVAVGAPAAGTTD
ncbi:hypothetical protein ACFWA9_29230 [Kitasatospora sp. NPDC059973]|uniref:hypothetical protein n=1 Tax=Kitasatospora sp. NPDC059973 TaxID=3347020 RepID=UPI0036C57FD3